MELILLGTSAAHPTVERASSGYLISKGDTKVLVDMGSGVVRNLMRWTDPRKLSAIVISHLHQDHFIDIYPLYYYLAFHESENLPLDVYAPEGAREFVLRILPSRSEVGFDAVYRFKTLSDREVFKVGDLELQSIAVKHNMEAYGLRVTSEAQTISYTADTDYTEVLYEIAANSDVFISEATKQEDYKDVLHLTAAQAGMIASKAGAKKLILTHIWPDFDPSKSKQMAEDNYDGPVIIAEDNMLVPID